MEGDKLVTNTTHYLSQKKMKSPRYTILEFMLLSQMFPKKKAILIDRELYLEHKIQYADEWLIHESFNLETHNRILKAIKLAKQLKIKFKLGTQHITPDAVKQANPKRIKVQIAYHSERLRYWNKLAKLRKSKL